MSHVLTLFRMQQSMKMLAKLLKANKACLKGLGIIKQNVSFILSKTKICISKVYQTKLMEMY